MKKSILIFILLASFFSINSFASQYRPADLKGCSIEKSAINKILQQVKAKNENALTSLVGCLKLNHRLIFQACLIDPSQLKNSDDIFKDSENFVKRLMKIHPQSLQYASDRLRQDKNFVKRASYIYRDALKYSHPKLRDNNSFMREMIKIDSRNYIFASKKIKSSYEHAKLAFQDNGKLIMYAPKNIMQNKKLAIIALTSDIQAYNFLDPKLQLDKDIKNIYEHRKNKVSKAKLEKFLTKNYIKKQDNQYSQKIINEEKRFFHDNVIVDRKYVVKWHRSLKLRPSGLKEKWQLINAANRNYQISWQEDFKEYPELVKKIEKFFLKRYIDKDTVDSLSTTYLWKVRNNPEILVFNLYLLRTSEDIELEDYYVNVTSMTAIAVKSKDGWRLTIVQLFLDNDIKADASYKHGHKKYIIQDLYLQDKEDVSPKIIFRVEDEFREYFEVYQRNIGNKYSLIYRIDPFKVKSKDEIIDDPFVIKRTREEQEAYEWQEMMDNCLRNKECAKKMGNTKYFDEGRGL